MWFSLKILRCFKYTMISKTVKCCFSKTSHWSSSKTPWQHGEDMWSFLCNGSSDSTQIIHQCDQNFKDSQMYTSAVNFPLVFMFSVRRQMSPVSARRVAFVFRDFPIGFI